MCGQEGRIRTYSALASDLQSDSALQLRASRISHTKKGQYLQALTVGAVITSRNI